MKPYIDWSCTFKTKKAKLLHHSRAPTRKSLILHKMTKTSREKIPDEKRHLIIPLMSVKKTSNTSSQLISLLYDEVSLPIHISLFFISFNSSMLVSREFFGSIWLITKLPRLRGWLLVLPPPPTSSIPYSFCGVIRRRSLY